MLCEKNHKKLRKYHYYYIRQFCASLRPYVCQRIYRYSYLTACVSCLSTNRATLYHTFRALAREYSKLY